MKKSISVAMAVYNGEKYIAEQIESILNQLSEKDELIISYNESKDSTWEIITGFAKVDKRVMCIRCDEKGVIPNFNNSIIHCSGEIIFLADQDDVWEDTKVKSVMDTFENNSVSLVIHNCSYIDSDGNAIDGDLFKRRNARPGLVKNLIKNSYQGSCIAFKSELVRLISPIPKNISMHDQWIGLIAEKKGGTFFLDEKLIRYRRHENVTSDVHIKWTKKVAQILVLVNSIIKRIK